MLNPTWCKCTLNSVIGQLEMCFGLNINVFYLDKDQLDSIAKNGKPNYRTKLNLVPFHVCTRHGKHTINVLLGGTGDGNCHAYLITKIKLFCATFRCPECFQTFARKDKLSRHVESGPASRDSSGRGVSMKEINICGRK